MICTYTDSICVCQSVYQDWKADANGDWSYGDAMCVYLSHRVQSTHMTSRTHVCWYHVYQAGPITQQSQVDWGDKPTTAPGPRIDLDVGKTLQIASPWNLRKKE